jgi:hypothetical protein
MDFPCQALADVSCHFRFAGSRRAVKQQTHLVGQLLLFMYL